MGWKIACGILSAIIVLLLVIGFVASAEVDRLEAEGGEKDLQIDKLESDLAAEKAREPEVLKIQTTVPQYIEVPVETVSISDQLMLVPFKSEGEFKRFVLDHRCDPVEGWPCVYYALRMQQIALENGKRMSTESIVFAESEFHAEGTGHEVNSAWIGEEKWYCDPVTGELGLMGILGSTSVEYDPDWLEGQEPDLAWKER